MMKYTKGLYSYSALVMGAKAFDQLCKVSVVDSGNYWNVEFSECRQEKRLIEKEFGNFVIGIINGADMLE